MTCFPLDNTDYTAKALGAWFASRTRGVFAADDNYAVTANGDMTVTVSPGIAWLKADTYWGVVVFENSSQVLALEAADGLLPRIDSVCIRLDKNRNLGEVVIKRGAYSPQPPTISPPVRNLDYDEIYIATVMIRAGTTSILTSDISDTRLDESLCGIMRDGVTGIPTQSLYDEFRSWLSGVQSQLSGDTATNLLALIQELERHTAISPATRAALGLGADATVDDALGVTATGLPWVLLESYTAAGTYTWTAPDLYDNGDSYEINVRIVGGGGCGGGLNVDASYYVAITGGASGRARNTILTVTPGQKHTLVVGAGGKTLATNGNSSSFGGLSVDGGKAGRMKADASNQENVWTLGADGAQGSDGIRCLTGSINDDFSVYAPALGQSTRSVRHTAGSNTLLAWGGITHPLECLNTATGELELGAGGGVWRPKNGTGYAQIAPILPDGFSAGSGVFGQVGSSATSPGSGGGATVFSSASGQVPGAGADGCVKIYVRRPNI